MTSAHDSLPSLRRLKQSVSMDDVLSAYGLRAGLQARGDQLVGPCPLHGGDHPTAFRVHRLRGLWHCFTSCGGGDIVALVCRIERCTVAQAARHLSRLASNLPAPTGQRSYVSLQQSSSKPNWRPFRTSIPLDASVPLLEHKGIDAATAQAFEAGLPDSQSRFLRGTIAVRLHDLAGRPLGYCGRRLDPEAIARFGKWRFPAGIEKAHLLYNAHRALPARHRGIVVVECPWAVMRLAQCAVPGAVALLGTALSPAQTTWLAHAPAVLLLLDGDTAGRRGATRIHQTLSTNLPVRIHHLPEGLDPDDLTDDELTALVRARLPSSLNPLLRPLAHPNRPDHSD